jgi:hypothetical protein
LTLSKSATQEREISLKSHKKDENLPNEEKKEKGPRLQEEETCSGEGIGHSVPSDEGGGVLWTGDVEGVAIGAGEENGLYWSEGDAGMEPMLV